MSEIFPKNVRYPRSRGPAFKKLCRTLICSPNSQHEYLGFPELPRKVIIFKITAMNSTIWQHESIAVLI